MKKFTSKLAGFLIAAVLLGLCAVAVYGVVTGQNLLQNIHGWWTWLFIIPGLFGLFHRGTRMTSFGLMLFGGIMLLRENAGSWLSAYPEIAERVGGISWQLTAVVVVVFLIALTILGNVFGIRRKYTPNVTVNSDGAITFETGKKSSCEKKTGTSESSAVFSRQDKSYAGQNFSGTELNAVFADYSLDLSDAIIEGNCTVEVNAIFGTVRIKTGSNANYVVNESRVFGSVSNATKTEVIGLPTVTVNANSVFGTVEII